MANAVDLAGRPGGLGFGSGPLEVGRGAIEASEVSGPSGANAEAMRAAEARAEALRTGPVEKVHGGAAAARKGER